jgi:hypothetical protein
MCVIRFGGEEAEYLTLTIHARKGLDTADYWDGNWLYCTADVSAGPFRGSVTSTIRTDDLSRFLPRLEDLYQRLQGEVRFDTMEDWLDVRIVGDRRGHVEVGGRLCDVNTLGNVLEFRLSFDQTYLPAILRQLRAALEAFPVVGRTPA